MAVGLAGSRRRGRRRALEVEADSAARMVATTAITGPALARYRRRAESGPADTSAGFRPLRTQNRNSVAGMPIASVQGLIASIAAARPPSIAGQLSPPAVTPRMCRSWLVAIRMPLAVMKPLMTGCDNRLARKPIRRNPSTASIMPDKRGKRDRRFEIKLGALRSHRSGALAVISETTATGPTASVRLVPKIA